MSKPFTVLAFDFGTGSIGVAYGQSLTGSARELEPLRAKDGQRPERVATLERDRMIEDVQNAHAHALFNSDAGAAASSTLARKLSNIRTVQIGAL